MQLCKLNAIQFLLAKQVLGRFGRFKLQVGSPHKTSLHTRYLLLPGFATLGPSTTDRQKLYLVSDPALVLSE